MGKDKHNAVGGFQPVGVVCGIGGWCVARFHEGGPLRGRQSRVEIVRIEINQVDLAAGLGKAAGDGIFEGGLQAVGQGMGEDDKYPAAVRHQPRRHFVPSAPSSSVIPWADRSSRMRSAPAKSFAPRASLRA
jgi:hypothetical protein